MECQCGRSTIRASLCSSYPAPRPNYQSLSFSLISARKPTGRSLLCYPLLSFIRSPVGLQLHCMVTTNFIALDKSSILTSWSVNKSVSSQPPTILTSQLTFFHLILRWEQQIEDLQEISSKIRKFTQDSRFISKSTASRSRNTPTWQYLVCCLFILAIQCPK